GPAPARRIDADPTEQAPDWAISAVLQPPEGAAHIGSTPRRIASHIGDRVPIAVVRCHEYQRIMRCAAPERAGTPGQDALRPAFGIALLSGRIGIVAHEEVPAHGRMLR